MSRSIDNTAKSVRRCSATDERRYVLIRLRVEKDLSHWAELTEIIAICKDGLRLGMQPSRVQVQLQHHLSLEYLSLPRYAWQLVIPI